MGNICTTHVNSTKVVPFECSNRKIEPIVIIPYKYTRPEKVISYQYSSYLDVDYHAPFTSSPLDEYRYGHTNRRFHNIASKTSKQFFEHQNKLKNQTNPQIENAQTNTS